MSQPVMIDRPLFWALMLSVAGVWCMALGQYLDLSKLKARFYAQRDVCTVCSTPINTCPCCGANKETSDEP